jgi:3-methyl-2-oxobutanoate hydroxymethyltransferase
MTDKIITINTLRSMKSEGRKIACLTAYDSTFATLLDKAGVDVILVGDSLGMVLQGEKSTLKVTMANMIYHSMIVKKGSNRPLLVNDMPFMSYTSKAKALGNAARLVAEGEAQVVKMEGGKEIADIIEEVVSHGIPVCAHLGLTPQSIHKLGGYKVQGRNQEDADRIMQDALILEQAGAGILVLECVPQKLAREITAEVSMPVIGIGAGADCDGQVLVLYDMLGLTEKPPKFSKNYLDQSDSVFDAIVNYVKEVKAGKFPGPTHCFD